MTGDAGGFDVATGAVPLRPSPGGADARRKAVQEAFRGLLHIRELMNTEATDPRAVPAAWERHQPVRAVALSLEASGIEPSAMTPDGQRIGTGYCVRATGPGVVRVEWVGPPGSGAQYEEKDALAKCVPILGGLGWEALLYRGERRRHYLEVEARG
ncbi:hypothetical protein [Streptomyces sp. NPDC003077]|uniref:hypothetical protein n=1 Tax=Streptomyces sp. NPDC003077 TaxID=3154443 RepID=UPI0033B1D33B